MMVDVGIKDELLSDSFITTAFSAKSVFLVKHWLADILIVKTRV